jgi:hypothetical protein
METRNNPQKLLSEELTLTHFLILVARLFQRLGLEVEDERPEEKLAVHVTAYQLPTKFSRKVVKMLTTFYSGSSSATHLDSLISHFSHQWIPMSSRNPILSKGALIHHRLSKI